MENSGNKKIAVNAVLNTFKTVAGILFPLITFPYVSRVLGVAQLGVYTFSASINSYFLLLASLGISTYGIREGAQYREDKEKIRDFVSEVFSINLIATAAAYVLLALCLLFIPKLVLYRTAIWILSAEILATTIGAAWVCNVFEDFLYLTIRTLAFQAVSLVLILTLVRTSDDLYKYIAILAFASSGANLLNWFYIQRRYCKFHFVLNQNLRQHLKPIFVIFSTSIAITIYVSADSTMLGFMTSDRSVGLYGTSVKIYTIIKNILVSILMVLIPRFSFMFSRNEHEKSNILFSKVFNILNLLMLPMIVGLFILCKEVILVISGEQYVDAALSLMLLSIAILFSLYAYMYTQCVLIPIKKEGIVFKATAISAIVNVGLNFILIPLFEIDAAAFTTVIAEAITFVIALWEGRKYIHLKGIFRNTVTVIAGCAGVAAVCLLTHIIANPFLRVGISAVGSAVLYLGILLVMKNEIVSGFLRKKRSAKKSV